MVNNIVGVAPPREVAPVRLTKDRARATENATATSQDGVEISSEAKLAAEVAHFVQALKQESEIRQKQVEEAKKQILAGSYKIQEAVLGVALKIQPYLE